MLAVGLTGGIGSGKSVVAELLVSRGAKLIDADRIARQVVEPGRPAFEALVARFGDTIVASDGTLDRPALAALTFSDPAALSDLNSITHPAIGAEMAARRQSLASTDDVVVLDVPLLVPAHRELLSLDTVVVVDCPTDIALERLVEQRGMTREDAEARIAAQPTREDRLVGADYVIDNSSDREKLRSGVEALWEELLGRARTKGQHRAEQ